MSWANGSPVGRKHGRAKLQWIKEIPFYLEFITLILPKRFFFRFCYYCFHYYYELGKGKWGFIKQKKVAHQGSIKVGTVAISGPVNTSPKKGSNVAPTRLWIPKFH